MTETDLLRVLQLAASPLGLRLFRNNVGMLQDARGRWVNYGVGGTGGADLIGWHTRVIGPHDVGRTAAIFVAVEGKVKPRKPTVDQMRFLDAVDAAGGRSVVAYTTDDLAALVAQR